MVTNVLPSGMFGSRLVLAPRSLLSCHPERSEGSAFRLSTLRALSVSALSSLSSPFNFKLSTACPERSRRVNFPPLTPFPATLTRHLQLAENKTTLSPAVATLKSRVNPNPFVCRSYKKPWGWGLHPSSQKPILFCLGPRLFWNWHLRRNPRAELLPFRPIRVGSQRFSIARFSRYESCLSSSSFHRSRITGHGPRVTSHKSLSPLESALTKNPPITPLESALPKHSI